MYFNFTRRQCPIMQRPCLVSVQIKPWTWCLLILHILTQNIQAAGLCIWQKVTVISHTLVASYTIFTVKCNFSDIHEAHTKMRDTVPHQAIPICCLKPNCQLRYSSVMIMSYLELLEVNKNKRTCRVKNPSCFCRVPSYHTKIWTSI